MIRITTLIENNQDDSRSLYYEHGLSLLIEAYGKRILFDTGQSGDFIQNAGILKQNLKDLDYVIISHGHYDHSGGFKKLVESGKVPPLVVGEEFFKPKYKRISSNEYKFNGNSFDESYLKKNQVELIKISQEVYYLTDHLILFHHFKRSNDFEYHNSKFFVREKGSYQPDTFEDEISFGIETEKGLAVIAGCSHAGIINILDTITERSGRPIYAVIGGTHLIEADEKRIQETIKALKNKNIQITAVSHCTGENGILALSQELKEKYVYNNTGNIIEMI